MKSHLFYYDLPDKFIAQRPLKKRDLSKLLVLDKKSGKIVHDIFKNLKDYLGKEALLVINKSKVNRCRIFAKKKGLTNDIECFILHRMRESEFLSLIRPSKKVVKGDIIHAGEYEIKIIEKLDKGKAVVDISGDIDDLFMEKGNVPLPPYIRTSDIKEEDYQTVFAQVKGSAAAPTAGLHFTQRVITDLRRNGIDIAEVILHIGLDTFRPIRETEIEDHKMHSEYYSIGAEDARKIDYAKKMGKKIIAVGTTATRVLETVYKDKVGFEMGSGWTDLYIKPGYDFKAIDGMITNFHLPQSTLIVMVSSFAGRENILRAYEEAKSQGYRFFSFGDAMLII